MKTYSQGTIRKHKSGSRWCWQGVIYVTENGKQRQRSRMLGIECDPPTAEEKRNGTNTTPKGKGARSALQELASWRQALIEKDMQSNTEDSTTAPMASLNTVEYVSRYWETRSLQRSTIDGYRSLLKRLDRPELDKPIKDLTSDDVQRWLNAERKRGASENMLRKVSDQLRYALTYAVKMGHIKANPCDPIQKPRRSYRPPNPLSADSLSKLIPIIEEARRVDPTSKMMADSALIAIHAGMRLGEILGLRWDDIDDGAQGKMKVGGYLHINGVVEDATGGSVWRKYTKTHNTRVIPMNAQIVRILSRIWSEQAKDAKDNLSGCFVISHPLTPSQFIRVDRISKEWAKFIKYRGILGEEHQVPHFHDLRHTFATQALQNNITPIIVSGILGHETIATTLRYYARWVPDQSHEAMETIGDALDSVTSRT